MKIYFKSSSLIKNDFYLHSFFVHPLDRQPLMQEKNQDSHQKVFDWNCQ